MNRKSIGFVLVLTLLSAWIFRSSFNNFFSQDDFFHMILSRNESLVTSFNIFEKARMDYYVYRPLTTQVFWKAGLALFGLNPFGYHLIAFAFFALNIGLVVYLSEKITRSRPVSFLAGFFYALSPANYYRLYFLSNFQETLMATLVFLAMILYLKKNWLAIPVFLISLTCKETAVVVPGAFLLLDMFEKRIPGKTFWLCAALSAVYFFLHKYFYGFFSGGIYAFDLNPIKTLNNYLWYWLWSLGFPESFVNLKLIAFPTLINPKFFTAFGPQGQQIVIGFLIFSALLIARLFKNIRDSYTLRVLAFCFGFFIIFILPVGFFPFHKFAYSLALPIFATSLILATLLINVRGYKILLGAYLVLVLIVNDFNISHHWITKSAVLSQKVINYFQEKYPTVPAVTNIYFQNNNLNYCPMVLPKGIAWSKEIGYALSGDKGLHILYNDYRLPVYYEDTDNYVHLAGGSIMLDSRDFFK